ncbi:MAG: zinc ribbon domain-containing protein [Candidatus Shapirobacteria bacterium]|nr:zinc ribbon domain-containing protein [Candidatus Shapirobacteria bacterium]
MEVPRHWRLKKQRLRLVGEECPHCSEKIFPPRDLCPRCNRGTLNNNLDVFFEDKSKPEPVIEKQRSSLGVLN